MATAFKTSVVTPEAIVLETTVTAAQIPAFDGLIGILHLRAPLLAKLGTGVLRLDGVDGQDTRQQYVVSGGYAEVKDDVLTILTHEAIPAALVTSAAIAAEEAKLHAVQGHDLPAMEKRQALQARLQAMRSVLSM